MAKTIQEINEKIKNGKAVVYNAEEIIDIVKSEGVKKAAARVDVVTTGTFLLCVRQEATSISVTPILVLNWEEAVRL